MPDGGMAMIFNAIPLAMEWQLEPALLDRRVAIPAVSASLAVMVATLLLWTVAAAVRRSRKTPFSKLERDRAISSRCVPLSALICWQSSARA
jgi:hypothetical protein